MKRRQLILARFFIETLIVAALVAVLLRFFVVSAYRIPTGAMLPTLATGDFVLVWKLPFGVRLPWSDKKNLPGRPPQRGEVVVFRYPAGSASHFVKRIVALPGDRLEIRDRRLYVNNVAARYEESEQKALLAEGADFYRTLKEELLGSQRDILIRRGASDSRFGPMVVPPDHVFVLADNRDSSDDSRYWGPIPFSDIEGQVAVVWISLDWGQELSIPRVRWSRVLQPVH